MIIAIGDVHGTTHWKDIVQEYKKSDSDIVVFLGDYLDAYHIPPEQCFENLLDIFEYRCTTPNVHLLVGNHDYHYMGHDYDRYSGYRRDWMHVYKTMLLENYHLLDMVYIFEHDDKKHICSHAGVSQIFLDNNKTSVEELNNLWKTNPAVFGFKHNTNDYYGEHPSQGPLWIRPDSLLGYAVKGYNQIVGHTNLRYPITYHTLSEDSVTVICTENKHGFLLLKSN